MSKNHQTKYRLICEGPEHLTTYNKEFNKGVLNHCTQDPKFQPVLGCLYNDNNMKCKYLETKKLT